ncbi:RNA polymerase sigma factor [Halomonas organivorans]
MRFPGQDSLRRRHYRRLVQPHIPHLLSIATQRTGSVAIAEDLVQESCLLAWEKLGSLKTAEASRPWLVRILLRQIADQRRSWARRQELLPITDIEEGHWQAIASEGPGPFELVVEAQSDARVTSLLRRLPDEFAIVVELHDLMGYRYREIAETLDIPLGTVTSRLARGRRLLAGLLAERHSQGLPGRGSRTSHAKGGEGHE